MTEAKYTLVISDQAGARQFLITDFLDLRYQNIVKDAGLLSFSVSDGHPMALSVVDRDWQIEVIRSRASDPNANNAISAYVDFGGFIRDEERITDSEGQTTVIYYAVGWNDLLRRSIVAYRANVTTRTQFISGKAETISKAIVTYNATTSGTTADGRDRNVPTWGSYVTVQTDGAGGNTLDVFLSRTNLLETLQDISGIGGGDFAMVKTGARAWQFRWYAGQLGTDRSASVVFALQYGNMANPSLKYRRLEERTVAIVAGQESGGTRLVETVTGTNYNASTNSYEVFVDGSDISTSAGLQDRGDARMYELRARDELIFDVIQTPGSLYGLHYFLGDKVTGYFQGATATKKINAVSISFNSNGQETIQLDLQSL
jgi:hypothetical protein